MLGLTWTEEDIQALVSAADKGDKAEKEGESSSVAADRPAILRYPLSLLIRPELINTIREMAIPSTKGGYMGMSHVPQDAISLFHATKEDFYKKIGATPVSNDEMPIHGSTDPLDRSRVPNSGFQEGAPRRFRDRR